MTVLAIGRIIRIGRIWRAAAGVCICLTVIAAVTAEHTIFDRFPCFPAESDPPGIAYWEVPGGRLAYYHLPAAPHPGNHAPVVFLHGGPGTPGEGLPIGSQQLAAQGYDIYAYDQLGAGRSTRLDDVTDYTVDGAVENLEQVRRAIGADKMILIGRSWGGSLLAQYLARHTDRVQQALFVTPGSIWGGLNEDVGEPWPTQDATERLEYEKLTSRPRSLLQSILLDINPNAARALVPDREADSWMRAVALTGRGSTTCANRASIPAHHNLQGFYSNQMLVRDFATTSDPRPALATVHVPTLVLAAQCDFIHWPVIRRYADAIPAASLIPVDNAGHGVSEDQPELFTRLIVGFITGQRLGIQPWRSAEDPWPHQGDR